MNILIIGHYGGSNFGDEAMLFSLLSNLNLGKLDVTVVSKSRDIFYFKEKGVRYISPSLREVGPYLAKTDLLILGGGTHFHDGYNSSRLRSHYFYLTKILLIYLFCNLTNKQVLQLGVGYGPLYSKRMVHLANLSLRFSAKTLVRDQTSQQWLNTLPTFDKVTTTFDLVGVHPLFRDNTPVSESKGWLGISLTSFNYNEYPHGDEFWDTYFIPAIKDLYESQTIKIKIFVFRGGEKESDLPLSKMLYDALRTLDEKRVKLVDYSEQITPFIKEIQSCTKFIATRYHSALIAYLSQCELFIIPYHEKLIALAQDIQLKEQAVFDIKDKNVKEISTHLNRFLTGKKAAYRAGLPVKEAVQKSNKNIFAITDRVAV